MPDGTDLNDAALFELQRPEWQSRSACHPDVIPDVWQRFGSHPVDLFYPDGKPGAAQLRAIRSVCGKCPVQAECEAFGVLHEREGFWGAVNPTRRAGLRSENAVVLQTPEIDPVSLNVIGTFIPEPHGTQARYQAHRRAGESPCDACIEGHRLYGEEAASTRWQTIKRTETPEERVERLAVRNRARAS